MLARRWKAPDWAMSPVVVVGVTFLVLLLLTGLLAPLPYNPETTNPFNVYAAPNSSHLFGTDSVGADVLSEVVRGDWTDLSLALAGTAASVVLGVIIALLVSIKSRSSEFVMRGLDTFQALPLLVLILALVKLGGGARYLVVIAIIMFAVPAYVRGLRGELLALRERRFVEAARTAGASEFRVVRVHLLPNLTQLIVAQTSFTLSASILAIAAMSFIGIGITAPTPSWGALIREGSVAITAGRWWLIVFPAVPLFLTVFATNAIADSVNSRLRGLRR